MVPQEELNEPDEIEIGPYRAGDEAAILRCFERVFGRERSLESWRWAYERNPAGCHVHVARRADGEVISQFAGLPRRVQVGDEVRCFAEIVDSMTDPRYRRGLKRPGWFARTCMAFVDHHGRPDGESVMYGLPLPGALRIGKALLGYVPLHPLEYSCGELDELVDRPAAADLGFEVSTPDDVPKDVDALDARIRRGHDVTTIRDEAYLRWRYVEAVERDYSLVAVRDGSGALGGLGVLAIEGPTARWLEMMAIPGEPGFEALCAASESWAKERGAEVLQGYFAPDSNERAALEERGYEPETGPWTLVARTYDFERLPIERLMSGWRPSLGDFDIF